MTHDSDVMAAAYLFGELEVDERRRFEEHLLRCEECWTEVESARRGMQALEATREFAPAHLRDKIREAGRGASERP